MIRYKGLLFCGHTLGLERVPAVDDGAAKKHVKTSRTSTTLMLLSVSFFYVATTLPMTFVYIVHPGFQTGDQLMTDQQVPQPAPDWQKI